MPLVLLLICRTMLCIAMLADWQETTMRSLCNPYITPGIIVDKFGFFQAKQNKAVCVRAAPTATTGSGWACLQCSACT
jgi:hypothetical protein